MLYDSIARWPRFQIWYNLAFFLAIGFERQTIYQPCTARAYWKMAQREVFLGGGVKVTAISINNCKATEIKCEWCISATKYSACPNHWL